MSVHIALLRAVNVGGNSKVAMADLRAMMAELGFDARSLLQSGNIVFRSPKAPDATLEKLLQEETTKRLSLKTDYFVRSVKEWAALIAANPFPKEAKDDPGHLVMIALKDAPKPAAVKALRDAIGGRETVAVNGRTLYVVYPDGIGRSKLTIGMIEKGLATRGTGRNWNTVLKIAALAAGFTGS